MIILKNSKPVEIWGRKTRAFVEKQATVLLQGRSAAIEKVAAFFFIGRKWAHPDWQEAEKRRERDAERWK